MKERRQARKDYNLGIDKKIEDERTATREELQKMANTEGAKNVKEMNEHLQTILVKSLEDRINRLSGVSGLALWGGRRLFACVLLTSVPTARSRTNRRGAPHSASGHL